MLAVSSELPREMSFPKLVIILGLSAYVTLSCWWRAGFYLQVSIIMTVILHLDGEWVVNGFVNLSMEKLPWYPYSFSATEFDTYLTYRIDVLELTSKEVKSSTLIHYFSPHLFHEYKCALRDLPCQKHNCFKYNREYHFRIKHLLFF